MSFFTARKQISFLFVLFAISTGKAQDTEKFLLAPYGSYSAAEMAFSNLSAHYRHVFYTNPGISYAQADKLEVGTQTDLGLQAVLLFTENFGFLASARYSSCNWRFQIEGHVPGEDSSNIVFDQKVRQRSVGIPFGIHFQKKRKWVGLYVQTGLSLNFLTSVLEKNADSYPLFDVVAERKGLPSDYRRQTWAFFLNASVDFRLSKMVSIALGPEVQYEVSNNFSDEYKRGHIVSLGAKQSLIFHL